MFKKYFALSILTMSIIQATEKARPWFEVKPSYFIFTSDPIKQVYNKGGFQIQASGNVAMSNYFNFYSSLGWRKTWGHALNTCECTNMSVVPFDLGIRSIISCTEKLYWFATIGPRFFYIHQQNKSPYVDGNISGGNVGFFANTGFNCLTTEHFFLGLFAEYSYETKTMCPARPNVYPNCNVQVGGVAVGVSLGWQF